jgi:hypothetical protein
MDASGEDQGRGPGEEISRPAPALEKIRKRKRVASSKLTHYSKRSLTAEIALAVIQPSVAARTTVRQQIRLAITRRYPSPGAPAICALGRPPARRRLRSAARPINRKLPVIPAHLPVSGQSLSRPSPHTATSLSASPFRQRGTAGDSDRKPKQGCAYC